MAHWRTADVGSPELSGHLGRRFTPLLALQACHMAELTGTLYARNGARVACVSFDSGQIVGADALEGDGIEALVAFAQWDDGRFEFRAGEPLPTPRIDAPFDWLVLEVCHRLDMALHLADADDAPVACAV